MSGDGNYLSTPSKVPAKLNRTGSAVGDFALERSPISSTARSTQYFVSTAPDQYQVRKQEGLQTDIGFSTSENKGGSVFAVEGLWPAKAWGGLFVGLFYLQSDPRLTLYVARTDRPFGATTGFLHLVKET